VSSGAALALVLVLVAVNACFVAAEYSIVTVRRSRVKTLVAAGNRRATVLDRVLSDLDSHLSAIQLAITSVSLAIGWLGEPAFASVIAGLLGALGITAAVVIHTVSFSLAFAMITAVLIIAGELAPKFLGLRRTEAVALWTAPLVRGFARMTRPALNVMSGSASLILRTFGVDKAKESEETMDSEELRMVLSQLSSRGRLPRVMRAMIENVFEFAEHTSRQVMMPRDKIDYVSLERTMEENLAIIMESGHTRYPLCESDLDSVVGMVHIKDLFRRSNTIQSSEDLRLIQHDMLFVPESQPIDELQRLFQIERAHMAVVVDEYGVPTGLVTLEDVLEELVGEIQDEFDDDERPQIVYEDDGVQIDGMLLVDDLCRELGLDSDQEIDADTVGGYVTNLLGKIPREGDAFVIGNRRGRVTEMKGRRVARVLLGSTGTRAA
jgi:CBS domain containing-hemolysin-like protein